MGGMSFIEVRLTVKRSAAASSVTGEIIIR